MDRFAAVLLLLLVLLPVWKVRAQTSPVASEPLHTLHLYTDLIQVPVLVLDRNLHPLSPIAPTRFQVRLDSGPEFQVTKARREGDDPLALAVLIDPHGREQDLLPGLGQALAAVGRQAFGPGDRISIYALPSLASTDCELISSMEAVPASMEDLQRGVERVLQLWMERKQQPRAEPACARHMQLWDAMAFVTRSLWKQHDRRRVLLTLSEGEDGGSSQSWQDVLSLTQATSTTVVGMVPYRPAVLTMTSLGVYAEAQRNELLKQPENQFHLLCELSGGLLLFSGRRESQLAERLQEIIDMLRGRYILEFPRSTNATSGAHSIEVEVAHGSGFYIRPAGVSAPLLTPEERAVRDAQEQAPGKEPIMGTRRILPPKP